jgi:hypothetical protein
MDGISYGLHGVLSYHLTWYIYGVLHGKQTVTYGRFSWANFLLERPTRKTLGSAPNKIKPKLSELKRGDLLLQMQCISDLFSMSGVWTLCLPGPVWGRSLEAGSGMEGRWLVWCWHAAQSGDVPGDSWAAQTLALGPVPALTQRCPGDSLNHHEDIAPIHRQTTFWLLLEVCSKFQTVIFNFGGEMIDFLELNDLGNVYCKSIGSMHFDSKCFPKTNIENVSR